MCLAAFFNGLAFNTSFSSVFLSGATLLLYPGIVAAPMVIRYAIEKSATRLVAFPLFYEQAANLKSVSLISSDVKFAYSAASRLSSKARTAFYNNHGLSIVDYYGLAETGPVTYEPFGGATSGTGVALPGCGIKSCEGILHVKTPYRATRYLNLPGKFESRLDLDGYLKTSDYAKISEERLFIGERSDGLLNIAGQKFDPSDTAEMLRTIRGVNDVHVFGLENNDGTHEVCAAMECSSEISKHEIRRLLGGKLEKYKIPTQIRYFTEMPRNGAGKLYVQEILNHFAK
jgi:acyl-coenzyme A synthetase/AMP-(fatty) acid ligase